MAIGVVHLGHTAIDAARVYILVVGVASGISNLWMDFDVELS